MPKPPSPFSILHDGLQDFAPSWQLPVLHGIVVAYNLRKRGSNPDHTVIQKILTHLLVSLGGGALACIVTARPVSAFLSNTLLPSYLAGHILIHHVPFTFALLTHVAPLWEPLCSVVDATARTWALTHGLDTFRTHAAYAHLARPAGVGQFALGVVSVTAGGVVYKWAASETERLRWPGWEFGVVCVVTAVYVLGWDVSVVGDAVREWVAPWVWRYGGAVGVPGRMWTEKEFRTVCWAVMVVGFLVGLVVKMGGEGSNKRRMVGRSAVRYRQQPQLLQRKGKVDDKHAGKRE